MIRSERMFRRLARALRLAALWLATAAAPAIAQAPDAQVHGRLLDAGSGAPIEGALVSLIGVEGRTARTDAVGHWRLVGLPHGRWTLRAQAIGYEPDTIAIAVVAGAIERVELSLAPSTARLDQVVITAARREQRLAEVVATTEVVNRGEIERTGAADLAAVLTEQTGVQLQGGHPSGAGIMLQGIGSERVLVLLDGQPLVGRISGNFDLSRIPTSIVERVEIVKGPQSTLYGSEAMGGVVNIVTRPVPDARWTGEARALAGSDGRLDGALRGTISRGAVALSADVGRRGIERAPGVASELGTLAERVDAAAKLRWAVRPSLTVESALLVLDERQRWRSGSVYTFADNVQVSGRAGASWLLGAQRLSSTLHVSHFDHLARSSQYTKPIAGTGDRQTQRLAEAEVLLNGVLGGRAVDVGLEAKQEYITTTDGRIEGGSRTLHSVEPFAQIEWATARWTVTPGARLTWNEQWGAHLSPRVAVRFAPVPSLTLRSSIARGFRAPDFKELWLDFVNDGAGYAVRGNADLRPEHSSNAMLGAEWTGAGDRLQARAQLFWNELRDFIETRPISSSSGFTTYSYANVERGRTRGVELETGLTLDRLRADASWALLDTRDGATGQPLLARPRHSARLGLGAQAPFGLRATVAAIHTGEAPMQRDETGAVTSVRDAFTRVDLHVAQRLPFQLELVLGTDNLFDTRPDRWAEQTGRQLYAGLTWRSEGSR